MPRKDINKDWIASVAGPGRRESKLAFGRDALHAQVRLLELLGSGSPLTNLLNELASYVDTWTDGAICTVMLSDSSGLQLLPGASPGLPDSFARDIGSVPIREGAGCCGTAAARRELIVVSDIKTSALWSAYAPVAAAHGLQACWSIPFFDDAGTLLGTLALYCREPRPPSESELDLIQLVACIAAFVIQRHRDSERLRESESRLSAAVWGTEIGLWESFANGECRWFNDWPERFDIDSCLGSDAFEGWRARMHPDDISDYEHCDDDCTRNVADHYSVDYRILDLKGRWRWVHERGRVVERSKVGTPTRFVGVCMDIDAQKSTQRSLQLAEERGELAINAARLPMWEYDVKNDIVRGNAYWHRAAGYDLSDEEATKRTESWLSNVHPDDVARHARIFETQFTDSQGFFESEFRLRMPTGEYKWFLYRARVVQRDTTGTSIKVVGISLDIDMRKRIEQAMKESEKSLVTALWGAQSAYWTSDFVANTTHVSDSFFQMTGITRATWDAEAEPWCSRVHADDAPMGCVRYRAHLEGKTDSYEHEYRILTPAGWRWLLDRGRVVERDSAGRALRMSGTTTDVSGRKAIERDIVEAVNREQRRISHDLHDGLGQQLTGIAFLLESAVTELGEKLPQVTLQLQDIVGHVRDTIRDTREMVQGLLPASLERGDLLPALRTLTEEIARTYRIDVQLDATGWETQRLSAETAQHVYRIAQEALNNARHHGHATRINLVLSVQGDLLSLCVQDNGEGIRVEDRNRGGIGLRIMDYRAQFLGGTIAVTPLDSAGTQVLLLWNPTSASSAATTYKLKNGVCDCISSCGLTANRRTGQ